MSLEGLTRILHSLHPTLESTSPPCRSKFGSDKDGAPSKVWKLKNLRFGCGLFFVFHWRSSCVGFPEIRVGFYPFISGIAHARTELE